MSGRPTGKGIRDAVLLKMLERKERYPYVHQYGNTDEAFDRMFEVLKEIMPKTLREKGGKPAQLDWLFRVVSEGRTYSRNEVYDEEKDPISFLALWAGLLANAHRMEKTDAMRPGYGNEHEILICKVFSKLAKTKKSRSNQAAAQRPRTKKNALS